jgi:beta-glucanase (GH16 family)
MRRSHTLLLLSAFVFTGCAAPSHPQTETTRMPPITGQPSQHAETRGGATPAYPADGTWTLVWSDEFEGPKIDPAKWTCDLGIGYKDASGNLVAGWGNNEKQTYTDRPENARIEEGHLLLTARQEERDGAAYTSARLKTKGLFAATYGKFEFRAKLPAGKGLWPALWLLPEENKYGVWAASGEIDIMEAKGSHPTGTSGAVHFGGQWPANTFIAANHEFTDGSTIEDFHVYSLEWEPGALRWYVDGHLFQDLTKGWYSGAKRNNPDNPPFPAPFDQPFHLIMNLAIGGNFDGDPWPDTKFPAQVSVDYVKVYQKH